MGYLILFVFPRRKADGSFLLAGGRFHQFPDSIKHHFELCIILFLEIFQFPGQFLVTFQHLPQSDKCPHDFYIDPDRPVTPQHAGEHGYALFCEGVG